MTFRLFRIIPMLLCAAVMMFAVTVTAAAGVLLGDADSDGEVTILDATCIQRTLAGLPVTGVYSAPAADADCDGENTILDATRIQRWLAGLDISSDIGSPIIAPTEPDNEQPTDSQPQWPTDDEGWGLVIFQP